MPVKSAKQWRFMQAVAHGGVKGKWPSKEIAQEFIEETSAAKRSTFAKSKKRKPRVIG